MEIRLIYIQVMLFLALIFASIQPAHLQSTPPSVWDVMRGEFKLDHQLDRPEVQKQLHWLLAHPGYLKQLGESKPYIYHIVNEIKKRHLPGEFALIPLIESAYDPFAYSHAGAAGLWQIMPETSHDLGIKRDNWADHRRSITPSTSAALRYFTYLHRFFSGNWDLAIAAYNAGEHTVARAVKHAKRNGKHVNLWSLTLPHETQLYLPRLLALAEIIQNPEHYHLNLPHIPHQPYFEEVNVQSHIDLNHAAQLAGMNYHDFIRLNPGFNRWTTTAYKPFTLLIPTEKVDFFYQNLAVLSHETQFHLFYHHVRVDETLEKLAKIYTTSTATLVTLNQLTDRTLHVGQTLIIPIPRTVVKNTITRQAITPPPTHRFPNTLKVVHIVQPDETLKTIATQYHTTPENIQNWNHLASRTAIQPKQTLIIWKQSSTT